MITLVGEHKHESFDTCSACNSKLRECKYCGNDVAMAGGFSDGIGNAVCNRCRDKEK